MSRKKKKPSAKRWRKAKRIGIAVVLWLATTIGSLVLGHYLAALLGW